MADDPRQAHEAALDELFPGDDADTNMLKSYLAGLWIDAGSRPDHMSFFLLAAISIGFPHVGGAYPDGGPEEMALALVEAIEAVRASQQRVPFYLYDGKALLGIDFSVDRELARLERCGAPTMRYHYGT